MRPNASRLGLALALSAAQLTGCVSGMRLPALEVRSAARTTRVYSARLSAAFDGPRGRVRVTVLAAFARPDGLRVEVPGPSGARLIVATQGGRLTALFPYERAVFEGPATAEQVEAVLGISLTPEEIMDLLVGAPSERVLAPDVRWGERYPRRVAGRTSDGTRLRLKIQAIDTQADLPASAFRLTVPADYRALSADEARNMWVRR